MKWKKISKARYWDMLEILPPACMGGGAFMVGEPYSHDAATGAPTFAGFKETNGQYFELEGHMTAAEFKKICPGVEPYAYTIQGEAI